MGIIQVNLHAGHEAVETLGCDPLEDGTVRFREPRVRPRVYGRSTPTTRHGANPEAIALGLRRAHGDRRPAGEAGLATFLRVPGVVRSDDGTSGGCSPLGGCLEGPWEHLPHGRRNGLVLAEAPPHLSGGGKGTSEGIRNGCGRCWGGRARRWIGLGRGSSPTEHLAS